MSLAKPSDIYHYITAYHAQKCCWHLTFFVRNYPTVQALAANLAIAAAYISAEAPIRSRVIMFENDIGRVINEWDDNEQLYVYYVILDTYYHPTLESCNRF